MKNISNSINLSLSMITTYLWFYRFIGITFGGLSINSNRKVAFNKSLYVFGYCYAITFSLVYTAIFVYTLSTDRFRSLYSDSGETVYWAVIIYYTSKLVHIVINLIYLNCKGSALLKVFVDFEMKTGRNQKINFVVWALHIVMPIGELIYLYMVTDISDADTSYQYNYCMFVILSFYYFFVIPHIIWNFSVHFYEFLRDIRKELQMEIDKYNGYYFY